MSTRQGFADILAEAFANIPELENVWVKASQDDVFVDSKITCVVSQTSVGPLPAAPTSHRLVGLNLTLVSPNPDTNTAADELEPVVDAVLDWLFEQNLTHGTATVDTYGINVYGPTDRRQFAYRIPVSVPAKKG